MTLYIFNPENDMALADGHPGYTPPAQIQQMRRELWWLPEWWAEEGDIVWNGEDHLSLPPNTHIEPWGWSPALRHQLNVAGVQESLLPSEEEINQIRQLSHRRTAVTCLQELREQISLDGHFAGNTTLCQSIEEVKEAINKCGEAILKSPWSSSGRGIKHLSCNRLSEGDEGWIQRILRQQGSIVVEQFLHKVADFALEFRLDGKGGVEYCGLSLFYTNEQGAYLGNWVAPEGQKLAWLAGYIPLPCLQEIRRWWEERLKKICYKGPVGIDMMLAQEGICPCIEINWRMTMGLISCMAAGQGRYGRMVVEYIYGHYSAEIEPFG